MRAGRVLLISAVVHGALGAVLSQIVVGGKRVVIRRAPEPEPIEIAIIEPAVRLPQTSPTTSADAPQPESAREQEGKGHKPEDSRGGTSADIGTSANNATSVPSGATSETTGSSPDAHGSSLMRMRGPDLGLDPGTAQRIAEAGGHDLPGATKGSGLLSNVSGGKAAIYDRVTTVHVEQDGTAHFDDKPDIDVHLKLPIPHIDVEGMRRDAGKLLTDWYADPYASTRFGRTQDLSNINRAVPGACDSWGSVECDDPLAPEREKYVREQKKTNGSLFGGAADITAYLHRKYVGDPYASRKLELLDDSRDERAKMGSEFRAQQLLRSAELITRNLARLDKARLPAVEQRAALFELWDECSEPSGGDEDEVGQAGQRARVQVIGWIRSHLPQTSPDAYSDDEIARLNAHRSSKQPFEPY